MVCPNTQGPKQNVDTQKRDNSHIFHNLALLVKASFYHIVCAPANFTKNVFEVDDLVPHLQSNIKITIYRTKTQLVVN